MANESPEQGSRSSELDENLRRLIDAGTNPRDKAFVSTLGKSDDTHVA
jgi:hypothetical protein